MITRFYINGIEVNEPVNAREIKLRLEVSTKGDKVVSFDGQPTWGIGDLRYTNDAYSLLNSVVQSGYTGGNGVAEGLPVVIEVEELGRKIKVLDAVLNLWDATFDEEKRQITCPIIEKGGIDWIVSNTQGVSFEYLHSIGKITSSDIILAPYVIEKQNQTLEKITALLTGIILYTQIREQISQIQQIVADAGSMSPWVAVLKIAVRIAYIIILLKTLFDTVTRLINLLIQPIKYIAGMTVKRHFEILFNHLGYDFKSSIFDNDEQYLVLFPEKYSNPKNKDLDDIKGWVKPDKSKQNGFYKGYGLQFCNIFRDYYNAKFIIDHANNTIYFERRDYVRKVASFTPPNVWQKTTLNKSDFFANHLFSFQTDLNDRHTIDDYEGVSSQVNISLIAPINPKLSQLDKGVQISVPFAMFKVKTELSEVEKILKGIIKTVDLSLNVLVTITNITIASINVVIKLIKKILSFLSSFGIKLNVKLNPIPLLPKFNFASQIDNRIGIFKMEDDIVSVPKLAYIKLGGSDINNRQLKVLRADDIQEEYHSIDYFTRGNQYKQGEGFEIPVNFSDIYDILEADQLQDGSEIISLEWSLLNNTANFQIRQPFQYLSGCLEETKIVPNGN